MATSKSNIEVRGSEARNSLDTATILVECCEKSAPCRFQLVHSGYSARVAFLAMHTQGIEFRGSFEEVEELILPQSICCVSFPFRTSFCAFLGCVIEVRKPKLGDRRVFVTIPRQLTTTNLRQSFRVPVIPQAGLQTTIRTPDDLAFVVTPLDIAEEGVEVEFRQKDNHNLSVGLGVIVEFQFRDELVQRKAEIRRVTGRRCGLKFEIPLDNKEGHLQSAAMHGIIVSLQQLWLKSRTDA